MNYYTLYCIASSIITLLKQRRSGAKKETFFSVKNLFSDYASKKTPAPGQISIRYKGNLGYYLMERTGLIHVIERTPKMMEFLSNTSCGAGHYNSRLIIIE